MRAIIFLLLTAVLWGLNFHLAKVMLQYTDFVEAGFWRYLIGASFLLVLTRTSSISSGQIRQHWKGISLVGIIGLFGFNLFFFWGLRYTSAVNAALIMSLNPALTQLLSNRMLGTKVQGKTVAGFFIALAGVLYLMAKGNPSSLLDIRFGRGDLLILLSCLLFALHHVWVKKYAGLISTIQFTLLTNVLCLLCFIFVLPFTGIQAVAAYPVTFWGAALGIGALGTALAYYLWNRGIKEIGADRGGIFMNVVPLSAGLLAYFFAEPLQAFHLLSGIIIVAGLMLTLARPYKTTPLPS